MLFRFQHAQQRSNLLLDVLLPVDFRRRHHGRNCEPAFAFVQADLFRLTPRRVSGHCAVADTAHGEHRAGKQALIVLVHEERCRHAGQDDQDHQCAHGVLNDPWPGLARRLREARRGELVCLR